jgi:hypothetical protein
MSSLSLTPFPTVEIDESGKRSFTQKIYIPPKKIKQKTGPALSKRRGLLTFFGSKVHS